MSIENRDVALDQAWRSFEFSAPFFSPLMAIAGFLASIIFRAIDRRIGEQVAIAQNAVKAIEARLASETQTPEPEIVHRIKGLPRKAFGSHDRVVRWICWFMAWVFGLGITYDLSQACHEAACRLSRS